MLFKGMLLEFDAVKSKVGPLNKYIKTSSCVNSSPTVCAPPLSVSILLVFVAPFGYLDFCVFNRKICLLNEYINTNAIFCPCIMSISVLLSQTDFDAVKWNIGLLN